MNDTETRAGLTVKALQDARFGAEILGLVPREITQAQREVIWDVYRERHGLICFSFGRLLENDELHALTAVFGEPEFGPGRINGIGKQAEPGEEVLSVEEQVAALKAKGIDPFLATIGNLEPDTLKRKPVAKTFFGEWEWHTDMSYIPVPPTFSLLHARIIPEEGGDTGFCNQVMAAKALPSALRERVLGLTAKHDSTYTSSGKLRPGMTPPVTPTQFSARCRQPAKRQYFSAVAPTGISTDYR
jgi:alpha-ketoglutarate-dependent taurine dioxygenase